MIVMSGLAAIIGSVASGVGNIVANSIQQRQANKQKYEDYMRYARMAGATPSAISAGITQTAAGSSAGFANSIPDVGSTINSAVSADAAQKQSEAAKEEAAAASTRAETERQLGLMKLKFEPAKYFAEIRKSLSEAFKNTKEAFLHGSMKQYYDELTKDVQQVRPWKIAGLRQGLLNDMATFGKIIQETHTSKAQEGLFKAQTFQAQTQAELNQAQTQYTASMTLNENLRGFRLQWENSLLSAGIDPNKPFWENTARLMYTNPTLFTKRMDMFISALGNVDSRLQENLGEHYKRNLAFGVGLYQLDKWRQNRLNNRNMRNNNTMRTIQGFIPFLGGSSSPEPSLGPISKVPWYLKEDYYY